VEINEALARMEIQNALWTYARGVDRSDYQAMISVYHPDAIDDHGSFYGLGTDFATYLVNREERMTAVGQHHITNMIIEMQGDDDARVESYFLAFHPHQDGDLTKLGIAAGRYLDHFQRRNGSWKILTRRVVMDWTRDHVDGLPWPAAEGKPTQGSRKSLSDESYEFFAKTPD
jgi:3-phenylpropionate/cinnamic acid dioxygenase small subunit